MAPSTSKKSKGKRRENTIYRDRADDGNDFEIVTARESYQLPSRGQIHQTERSEQRGLTSWSVGDSWMPEDNPELGLEQDFAAYDAAIVEEIFQEDGEPPTTIPKKKKTQASVGFSFLACQIIIHWECV
jgi:hypothetical protein